MPLINQIGMYPLAEFTGTAREFDWLAAPVYGDATAATSDTETAWVTPETFFADLGVGPEEVPARPR